MKKKTSKKGSRKAQDARKRRERRRQKTQNREKGLSCKPLFEGLPDAGELVQIWQQEHGPDIECQAFREFVRLKKQNEEAWAAGLCQGLELGSAAALCAYGMEPRTPWDTAPGMRRLDEAFAGSATCEAHKESLRRYEELFLGEAQLLHSGKEELSDEERETARGRALGLTALEAACEQDFPAAFVEFFKQAPRFVSFWLLREDGRTTTSEQCHWLVRGMELDIESCVVLLARELRRGTFLPLSAEEEEALLEKLYRHALKGSWEALHELILHLLRRPAFWRLPVSDKVFALLCTHFERKDPPAVAHMLWSLYFGSFKPLVPPMGAQMILAEVRRFLRNDPSRALLHCLTALSEFDAGRQKEGYRRLLRCRELEQQIGSGEQHALRLLARLPHSGKDNLRLPDSERLEQLCCLERTDPGLPADYLWQGLVCNEGTSSQKAWLQAAAATLPPQSRSYLEGLMTLHGFGGRQKDVGRALDLLAQAAKNHFLPALGLLADITGRGLCGCTPGPYQGTDWVEAGCRHLVPRALAVHGLLSGRQRRRNALLKLPLRSGTYTLDHLFSWCGRQDEDCLCLACQAISHLDRIDREEWHADRAVAPRDREWDILLEEACAGTGIHVPLSDYEDYDDLDDLDDLGDFHKQERQAERAGIELSCALCLALATADAGTLLYLGRELHSLAGRDMLAEWPCFSADMQWALARATGVCLDVLVHTPRRKTLPGGRDPDALELEETAMPLLIFFCLERARFFGEPAADELLASFCQEDKDRHAQLVAELNLAMPLRSFFCLTDNLLP